MVILDEPDAFKSGVRYACWQVIVADSRAAAKRNRS